MRSRIRFDPTWILVLVLTVFAVAPLTYPGFFETQSGFLPTFKLENLSAAPDWAWPAGPIPDEGKLPYLLVWPFLQITGSGLAAIRWGYALAFALAALGVYVGPWGAIELFYLTVLAGGILAVARILVAHGPRGLKNWRVMARGLKLPYGLAICAGVLWLAALKGVA